MPEQPWEPYESTKEMLVEAILASMGSKDDESIKAEANKVGITCCSRVGTYRLEKPCLISITFHKRDNKEKIMAAKRNLPEIFINHEYPSHIQRARDRLRSILKFAKSIPHYKDRRRPEDDRLVINGISYTLDDLNQLPPRPCSVLSQGKK